MIERASSTATAPASPGARSARNLRQMADRGTWHRRLAADGTWDAIHQALTAFAAQNDRVDFTVSVDSTIARAHQHATNISRVKKELVELPQGSARRLALTAPSVGRAGACRRRLHQLVRRSRIAADLDLHGWPGRRRPDVCSSGGAPESRSTHPPGRGPWRQGVLVESEPCALAVAEDRGSHFRTIGSAGTSAPAWVQGRPATEVRRHQVQGPQRDRAWIRPFEAVARTGHSL